MNMWQRSGILLGVVWLTGCSAFNTRNSPAPVEERTALEATRRSATAVPTPRAAPAPQYQAQRQVQPEPEALVQPYVREAPITPQALTVEVLSERQQALAQVDPTPVALDRPPTATLAPRQTLPEAQPVERPAPVSRSTPVPQTQAAPAGDASAVGTLLASAQQAQSSGNPAQAAATLERALRLEPRNAKLWHELARVRLAQGQPGLAEALARKSSTLAGDDADLRQRNNTLISEAQRQSQGR
jgi:tetratricopeptide (TPR) repeat protein